MLKLDFKTFPDTREGHAAKHVVLIVAAHLVTEGTSRHTLSNQQLRRLVEMSVCIQLARAADDDDEIYVIGACSDLMTALDRENPEWLVDFCHALNTSMEELTNA